MPISIRPYRQTPVCFPVSYHVGDFEGHGTAWNFSLTGWRFSGNLPLREGEIFSLTMTLPSGQRVYVMVALVCWVRGEDCGAETITMDDESRDVLGRHLDQELHNWMESHW
jgi:hypothetical protein